MKELQKNKPAFATELCNYVQARKTFYCMPGHKQGKGAPEFLKKIWGESVFQYDLTEVRGSDVLSYPKRELLKAQNRASSIMGAHKSWFLVNGSSVGVYAVLSALIRPGEKVLIHRECHKSVLTGLVFSGALPVYFESMPQFPEYAYGSVDLENFEKILQNHDIKMCCLTSPNYYGISLDISSIAEICRKYNTVLFVDEAHGTHFCLNDNLPLPALHSGADYVVHSMHKTLGGLYQCAILHSAANSELYDEQIDVMLSMLQTTSPSALFLMSIDAALNEAQFSGGYLYEKLIELIRNIRLKLNNTFFEVIEPSDFHIMAGGFSGFDPSKIIFRSRQDNKINLFQIKQTLSLFHDIEIELADERNLLLTLTMADAFDLKETETNLLKFSDTIEKLAEDKKYHLNRDIQTENRERSMPTFAMTPRDAFFASKNRISLLMAENQIASNIVCIYPPGCPIIVPGERFNSYVIDKIYRKQRLGFNVVGISESDQDLFINVIK